MYYSRSYPLRIFSVGYMLVASFFGETTLLIGADNNPAVPPPSAVTTDEGFRIGSGDVLQVQVWKEPDASVPAAVVRPDGKIALPLLKEVEVVGLTPRQVERRITERLAPFIRDADVTIVVTAINSRRVYVLGAVRKEGPITLQSRMTILQVLSEAGGLNEYAKKKKIYLLRAGAGKQIRLPFNYEAVIKGEDSNENVEVAANDTIVVPQ